MNCRLFHLIVFVLLCCCPVHAQPPDSLLSFPMSILRLRAFGECIPQEKVYVHLDNRCYFIGDTIWFKAYTQQTNNSRLSEVSGTLYVELFDQEGYLKERKLVEMKHGQGRGVLRHRQSGIQWFLRVAGLHTLATQLGRVCPQAPATGREMVFQQSHVPRIFPRLREALQPHFSHL